MIVEDLEPDAVDLDAWCRRVDELVADGVDPFLAIVDADLEHRGS